MRTKCICLDTLYSVDDLQGFPDFCVINYVNIIKDCLREKIQDYFEDEYTDDNGNIMYDQMIDFDERWDTLDERNKWRVLSSAGQLDIYQVEDILNLIKRDRTWMVYVEGYEKSNFLVFDWKFIQLIPESKQEVIQFLTRYKDQFEIGVEDIITELL